MSKKEYIGWIIGLPLACYALVGGYQAAYAKPMVECKNGMCQISEEDWNRFREFHLETRKQMARIDESIANQNQAYIGLMGALAACQARTPQKEV